MQTINHFDYATWQNDLLVSHSILRLLKLFFFFFFWMQSIKSSSEEKHAKSTRADIIMHGTVLVPMVYFFFLFVIPSARWHFSHALWHRRVYVDVRRRHCHYRVHFQHAASCCIFYSIAFRKIEIHWQYKQISLISCFYVCIHVCRALAINKMICIEYVYLQKQQPIHPVIFHRRT